MDLTRAKVLLKKMNRLVEGMDSDEHLSTMERDLMRAYLRDLYDFFLHDAVDKASNEKKKSVSSPDTSAQQSSKKEQSTPEIEDPDDDGLSIPRLQPDEEQAQSEEEHQPESAESAASSTPPNSSEESTSDDSSSEVKESEEEINIDDELEELFDIREGNELSERLSHMPVRDLSRAMGLNERIYTINELFGGDHALFDEVLETLNDLDSFEEAKKYLTDKVAREYDWTHPDRKKKAHHFIRLVRRRYKRQVV